MCKIMQKAGPDLEDKQCESGRQAIKQNNIMGLFQIIRRWNYGMTEVMFKMGSK